MKGSGHGSALSYQDGEICAFDQHLDAGAGGDDTRGPDEDGLHGSAGEFGVKGQDRRVFLGAVGVAFDGDVEDAEAALGLGRVGWVTNLPGQEDGSGAGSEDGLGAGEGLEGFQKAAAFEELQHGG